MAAVDFFGVLSFFFGVVEDFFGVSVRRGGIGTRSDSESSSEKGMPSVWLIEAAYNRLHCKEMRESQTKACAVFSKASLTRTLPVALARQAASNSCICLPCSNFAWTVVFTKAKR